MLLQELPNLDLLNKANAELRQLWNGLEKNGRTSKQKRMSSWLQLATKTLRELGIDLKSIENPVVMITEPLWKRVLEVRELHKSGCPSLQELMRKDVIIDMTNDDKPSLTTKRNRKALEDKVIRVLGILVTRKANGKAPIHIGVNYLRKFLGVSSGTACKVILEELTYHYKDFVDVKNADFALKDKAGVCGRHSIQKQRGKKNKSAAQIAIPLTTNKQITLAKTSTLLGFCEKDDTGAFVLSRLKILQYILNLEGYKSLGSMLPPKNASLEALEKIWNAQVPRTPQDTLKQAKDFESLDRIYEALQGEFKPEFVNKFGDGRIYHLLVNVSKRVREAVFGGVLNDVDVSACFPSILPVLVKEYLVEGNVFQKYRQEFLVETAKWNSHRDLYLMPCLFASEMDIARSEGKKILNHLLNAPTEKSEDKIKTALCGLKKEFPTFSSVLIRFYEKQNIEIRGKFFYRAAMLEQEIVTHLQHELFQRGVSTINFHDGLMLPKGSSIGLNEIQGMLNDYKAEKEWDVNLSLKLK